MKHIEEVSIAYFKLLISIDWDDELMVLGLREGLNKFPSNAYLSLLNKNKYLCGDYYSLSAIKKIKNKK